MFRYLQYYLTTLPTTTFIVTLLLTITVVILITWLIVTKHQGRVEFKLYKNTDYESRVEKFSDKYDDTLYFNKILRREIEASIWNELYKKYGKNLISFSMGFNKRETIGNPDKFVNQSRFSLSKFKAEPFNKDGEYRYYILVDYYDEESGKVKTDEYFSFTKRAIVRLEPFTEEQEKKWTEIPWEEVDRKKWQLSPIKNKKEE